MTERLYYHDSYLREFAAQVTSTGGDRRRATLALTAFYPASGGQPHDTGFVGEARVVDVLEEGDEIVHVLDREIEPGEYLCRLDWERRFDHMQQHTGQHLLSAVFSERYRFPTLSFHLGGEASTIELGTAALAPEVIRDAERIANDLVTENRAVTVSFHDAAEAGDLRKASERAGTLRVVSIEGLDRSACGGTHVRRTGEIGSILVRGTEKIRGNVRLEFVCGRRAVARARADRDILERVARLFSAAADALPDLVAAQGERLAETEKARRKLTVELARYRGQELYRQTTADPRGRRVHVRRIEGALTDELRAEAQAFCENPAALFLALAAAPPSLMLATSAQGGPHAAATLKPLLDQHGGRGGGNAQIAQGSLADADRLAGLAAALTALLEI